jgi:hypothetical protein
VDFRDCPSGAQVERNEEVRDARLIEAGLGGSVMRRSDLVSRG